MAKSNSPEKFWQGALPDHCDLCGRTLSNSGVFYDGKTKTGPWAFMCSGCFPERGVGLGPGLGQQYTMKAPVNPGESPVWVKSGG